MQPAFFINHGGGPCFFLWFGLMRATRRTLEDYLQGFASALTNPPPELSGQTYHHMRGCSGAGPDAKAQAFDSLLRQAITCTDTPEQSLIDGDQAQGARDAQPREDHLLPLMVAAAAGFCETAIVDFHGFALCKPISGFSFG